MKTHIFAFVIAIADLPAYAATVVSPSARTASDGNGATGHPFSQIEAYYRWQQVFVASDFVALGGPLLVSAISLRPNGQAPWTYTLPNVQLSLSTTAGSPSSLNSTFAQNVGSDRTTVFSGQLTLQTANTGPSNGPKAFDIVIPFQTPFLYNPLAGNLLIDISNFSSGFIPLGDQLDSEFYNEGQAGSTAHVSYWDASSPSGIPVSGGLIVQFSGSVVPEPTTTALILFGTMLSLRRKHIRTNDRNANNALRFKSSGSGIRHPREYPCR